jgi:hypothetical protein
MAIRSVYTTTRDGYVKITNPDAIPSTKVNTIASRIGSAEKQVVFGSLDVIEPLTVEGELLVLVGTPLSEQTLTVLNSSITENTTLYGPVLVNADGVITIGATLTIL